MSSTTVLFRFVLIALFLFSYQTTTIHSKHHFIEELSECHVCKTAKELGTAQHETVFSQISESIAVELNEVEEKRIVNSSYDLTQTPQRQAVDYEGMSIFSVGTLPLGYHATAPPYIFS